MISRVKISDNSLQDIQDKLLNVLGPLCTLYENCAMIYESMNQDAITILVGMFNCVKKSLMLVGDTSAQLSAKRREQVLTKLNPVLSSLGKEEFPDAGKQLFGDGFESRLKLRSEMANTVHQAKKAAKQLFRGSASRRFQGRFRGGRGQHRGFQGFYRLAQGFQSSTPSFQGRGRAHNYTLGSVSAKPTSSAVNPSHPTHLPSGMFEHLFNSPDLPLAGRFKHFLPAWEQITRNPWVLQVVLGYRVQFSDNPVSCA